MPDEMDACWMSAITEAAGREPRKRRSSSSFSLGVGDLGRECFRDEIGDAVLDSNHNQQHSLPT